LSPFFTIQKEYLRPYEITEGRELLDEIVNAKYNSTKFSIYGINCDKQDEYLFWTKQSLWRPPYGTSRGAVIIVKLSSSNGQTRVSAVVSVNPIFWLLVIISLLSLGVTFFIDGQRILFLVISCSIFFTSICLDRLNKKMLLALLERYL
jgi:hypothetical protein